VAKLAGVPQPVIAAARRYLAQLEAQRDAQALAVPSLQGSLPFGAVPAVPESGSGPPAFPDAPPDPLRERLAAVDPDRLSPREAHELLYALKELLSQP
jgi:DNA mismatch repair protein MutS